MRRLASALLTMGVLLVMVSTPASGIVKLGARVGLDDTAIDAYNKTFDLGLGEATVVRDEIDRPFLFGAVLETGLLPIFDLELAGEVALKKYHLDYSTSAGQETSEDVSFARVSAMATLKKDLLSFPPVTPVLRVYAGGGVGLHFVTPLIGEALVTDKLAVPTDALDPDDIVDYEFTPAFHGLAGAALKPAFLPFAINTEARYIVKDEGDFEEPGSHWSGYAGLLIGF